MLKTLLLMETSSRRIPDGQHLAQRLRREVGMACTDRRAGARVCALPIPPAPARRRCPRFPIPDRRRARTLR